jgi:hypothetical protein
MSTIVQFREQKRFVRTPSGEECTLVWARKVLPKHNIYELSLERLDGGYTAWFAYLEPEIGFKFISCAYYMSRETLLIMLAEEGIEVEEETLNNLGEQSL